MEIYIILILAYATRGVRLGRVSLQPQRLGNHPLRGHRALTVAIHAKRAVRSRENVIAFATGAHVHPKHARRRGFAFINFFAREDAQKAIDKLDGHGYDHLILSVTWANPSAQGPRPEAPGMDARAFPTLGGPGGGTTDVRRQTDRFDKHVFDSGLDRFRT